MFDAFLEVLAKNESRHAAREEMADAFMALPTDELHKIASGTLKLADYDDHEWLTKFKGTPLYEPALQLEQQCLEFDIQQKQLSQARNDAGMKQEEQAMWDAQDGIRLKKRMLDLELLKMESSAETGGNIASGAPAAPDMQQEQAAAQPNPQGVAGAPMENAPKQASVKTAGLVQKVKQVGKALSGSGARKAEAHADMAAKRARNLRPEILSAPNREVGKEMLHRAERAEVAAKRHAVIAAKARKETNIARGVAGGAAAAAGGTAAAIAARKEPEKTSVASVSFDDILKLAAELQAGQREKIKSKNFAVKSGGEEKYPVHDAAHARNALVRVRQFGSPAEKAKVFSAVTKKYPALATRSEVIPEKTQAKAEKKLGLPKGGESQKTEAPKQKLGGVPEEILAAMRMQKLAEEGVALGKEAQLGAALRAVKGALPGLAGKARAAGQAALGGVRQLGGGFKQLGQAAKAGYGGVVNQAGGLSSGLRGAAQGVGSAWSNIAKTSPGLAAGLVAAPVAVAGMGVGHALHGKQQQQ